MQIQDVYKLPVGILAGYILYFIPMRLLFIRHRQDCPNRSLENCTTLEKDIASTHVQAVTDLRNESKLYIQPTIHKPEDNNPGKNLRIACYLLTYEKNHETRVKAVRETWGKRCNYLFFVSTKTDRRISAINFGGKPLHQYTYGRSKMAAVYAYRQYKDKVDWFVKADDDTYMIMENLRLFLSRYDTKQPIFFGCRFKPYVKQGYFSGGAGYVMSREAMRRLVEEGIPNPAKSPQDDQAPEDVKIGITMYNVGVRAMDTRDNEKYRFFPFPIRYMNPLYNQSLVEWFPEYVYYPFYQGSRCCSSTAISFHFMESEKYFMEYFVYQVGVYGR